MRTVWFTTALTLSVVVGLGALAKTAKHAAPAATRPLVIKDCRDCPEMVAVPAASPNAELRTVHRGSRALRSRNAAKVSATGSKETMRPRYPKDRRVPRTRRRPRRRRGRDRRRPARAASGAGQRGGG